MRRDNEQNEYGFTIPLENFLTILGVGMTRQDIDKRVKEYLAQILTDKRIPKPVEMSEDFEVYARVSVSWKPRKEER